MRIYTDTALRFFEFWSGGADNAAKLTNEELDRLDDILSDEFSDGLSEMELNDLFWFDFATVCEWLGYEYDEEADEIIR